MSRKNFIEANEEIAEKVTAGFQRMSDGVVKGCTKVQDTVVGGYTKIEDAFVGKFLTHEGETVEEAKARLKEQTNRRQEKDGEEVKDNERH